MEVSCPECGGGQGWGGSLDALWAAVTTTALGNNHVEAAVVGGVQGEEVELRADHEHGRVTLGLSPSLDHHALISHWAGAKRTTEAIMVDDPTCFSNEGGPPTLYE